MVDALWEAHRVLKPSGAPIDVRPVTAPIVLEVVIAMDAVCAKTVYTDGAQEDVAAADAAVQLAVSRGLLFDTSLPFLFEIYCNNAADLRLYAEVRKLRGAEIPYEELEERTTRVGRGSTSSPGLRCRRPWMLSTYRKK